MPGSAVDCGGLVVLSIASVSTDTFVVRENSLPFELLLFSLDEGDLGNFTGAANRSTLSLPAHATGINRDRKPVRMKPYEGTLTSNARIKRRNIMRDHRNRFGYRTKIQNLAYPRSYLANFFTVNATAINKIWPIYIYIITSHSPRSP